MIIRSFWGLPMSLVFNWCDNNNINYDGMAPSKFAEMMDRTLLAKHPEGGTPDECANIWLKRIAEIEYSNKHSL